MQIDRCARNGVLHNFGDGHRQQIQHVPVCMCVRQIGGSMACVLCFECAVTPFHRQGRGFYSVYKQLLGVLYFDSIRVARCEYIYWRSGIDISKSVSLAVLMKTSRADCFHHEAVPCDAPRNS